MGHLRKIQRSTALMAGAFISGVSEASSGGSEPSPENPTINVSGIHYLGGDVIFFYNNQFTNLIFI